MIYVILFAPLIFWITLGIFAIGALLYWWFYEKDI